MSDPDGATSRALKLWVVLSRAFFSIREHVEQNVDEHGLSLTEFGVLEALYHKGKLQLCDIQEKILVSSGGITYLVDQLEEKELVERQAHPEDRRARLVALTERGRERMEQIFPDHAACVEYATSGLDERQRQRATDLIRELGRTAEALPLGGRLSR